MSDDPTSALTWLQQAVSFLKSDAGLVGIALAFIVALYFGALHWGKDYDKLEKRAEKAEGEVVAANAKSAQLELMVQRLTGLLERASSGFERTVVQRIAQEEGIGYEDAMEKVAALPSTRGQGNEQFPRRHPHSQYRQPRPDRQQDE